MSIPIETESVPSGYRNPTTMTADLGFPGFPVSVSSYRRFSDVIYFIIINRDINIIISSCVSGVSESTERLSIEVAVSVSQSHRRWRLTLKNTFLIQSENIRAYGILEYSKIHLMCYLTDLLN